MRSLTIRLLSLTGLLSALALLPACGGSAGGSASDVATAPLGPSSGTPEGEAEETNDPPAASAVRYAWVNDLNVRAEPRAAAAIVTKVQPTDELKLTGKNSGAAEPIVLRGILFEEPWLEVALPDGQTGWVYGGAVRGADEVKGGAPLTSTTFNYPAFGNFDLSQWETLKKVELPGEDVMTVQRSYGRDDRTLVVEEYHSEYGMGSSMTLRGGGGYLLKERVFKYDNLAETITESVTDHSGDVPVTYLRERPAPGPYQQLNAEPRMLTGNWTKKEGISE